MGLQEQGWFMDRIRELFCFLDKLIYSLVKWILFGIFDLANLTTNSNIFSGVYSRIYVILGIFMAFKLSFSFFQYIIDPESMSGKGDKTLSKLFTRVFVMLAALMFLPTVLFGNGGKQGLLSRAQEAFLPTLPKIIFGVDNIGGIPVEKQEGLNESEKFVKSIEQSSDDIAITTLSGFFTAPDDLDKICGEGSKDKALPIKTLDDFSEKLNRTCNSKGSIEIAGVMLSGAKYYQYSYMFGISTVVGGLVAALLLGITLAIAKRIFKLIVLEVIAPIPIMSLIDPKSSKDGAFRKWWTSLLSTFGDIFMKLGLVYMIIVFIHMIVDPSKGGLFSNFPSDSAFRATYLKILLILGLIFFAKEAPKFIKEALGFKGEGGLLDDVKSVGKAAGLVAGSAVATAGTIGAMRANWRASKDENELEYGDSHKFRQFMKNSGSAIAGAIGGSLTAQRALMKKDASPKSVMEALSKRNARRAQHSTLPNRILSTASGIFAGRGISEKGNKILQGAKDFVTAQSAWKKILEEEASKNGAAIKLDGFTDAAGDTISARYEEVARAVESAHDGVVTINGTDYDSNRFTKSFMEDLLKKQVIDYQKGNYLGMNETDPDKKAKYAEKSYDNLKKEGQKLYKAYGDVTKASHDVKFKKMGVEYNVDDAGTFGQALGAANKYADDQENKPKYIKRRSADSSTGNNKSGK